MSITITLGKAGRLVVPKAIRESLGLREGARLRIESSAGKFEVSPGNRRMSRSRFGLRLPVIRGGLPRKKGDIVKALEAGRDARADRILAHRKTK